MASSSSTGVTSTDLLSAYVKWALGCHAERLKLAGAAVLALAGQRVSGGRAGLVPKNATNKIII